MKMINVNNDDCRFFGVRIGILKITYHSSLLWVYVSLTPPGCPSTTPTWMTSRCLMRWSSRGILLTNRSCGLITVFRELKVKRIMIV